MIKTIKDIWRKRTIVGHFVGALLSSSYRTKSFGFFWALLDPTSQCFQPRLPESLEVAPYREHPRPAVLLRHSLLRQALALIPLQANSQSLASGLNLRCPLPVAVRTIGEYVIPFPDFDRPEVLPVDAA